MYRATGISGSVCNSLVRICKFRAQALAVPEVFFGRLRVTRLGFGV